MIEVVDAWLAKLYPKKPTWREVADIVEQIGHVELSRSLRQVYVTGEEMEMRSRMCVEGDDVHRRVCLNVELYGGIS